MSGIVGIDLPEAEVHRLIVAYVNEYTAAENAARTAAGGSLRSVPGQRQPWQPEWPRELTPAWAASVDADDGDGLRWYTLLDGPRLGGVFVSQNILIDLSQCEGMSTAAPVPADLVSVEVEPLCVTDGGARSEFILSLDEAREHTRGMIAAGKLMASLLEPAGGE